MDSLVSDISIRTDVRPWEARGVTLLVVAGEAMDRAVIRAHLAGTGFRLREAETEDEVLAQCRAGEIGLVLLDLTQPGLELSLCGRIRAVRANIGIIVLTGDGGRADLIHSLQQGADDSLARPWDPEELEARITAVLRRTAESCGGEVPQQVGNLRFDIQRQKCFKHGRDLNLTPKEFALLSVLCGRSGLAVTRAELANQVWGDHHYMSAKCLDVHIQRIRQKVDDDPTQPGMIRTVRGVGYACTSQLNPVEGNAFFT